MSAAVHRAGLLTAAVAACWWLFGDTYRYYPQAGNPPNVIRFSHFGTYQDYQQWSAIIDAFELAHPEMTVRQEYVVGLSGLYNVKLSQQVLSGTLPDVVLVQAGPFASLAGAFDDLADLVAGEDGVDLSRFHATSVRTFMDGGRVAGLPVSGGNLLIYCNLDGLDRASAHRGFTIAGPGDDWTLEQFRSLAEALTCDFDGDGRIDQFGFWLPRWIYYLPFLWSFGADVAGDDGQWRLTGPEAEAAFAFYQGLATGNRVCPRPEEVAQLFQDVAFLTGRVAMCVNGPWFRPFLEDTRLRERYAVAHIPTGPAGRATRVTWDGLCIPAGLHAERRRSAWTFVRFVCSDSAQSVIASSGRALPALTSGTAAFVDSDPLGRAARHVDALAYSRLQPLPRAFQSLDRALNRHIDALLSEERPVTPGEFLDRLLNDPAIADNFQVGLAP